MHDCIFKRFVENTLALSKFCLSNVVKSTDSGKATLIVNKVNEHLSALQLDTVDNSNITGLNHGELHLNEISTGKLTVNFIEKKNVLKDDDR